MKPAIHGPYRFAVYARCAPSSQADPTTAIEEQVQKCLSAIARVSGTFQEAHAFLDNATSGLTSARSRPGLTAFLTAAASDPRPFDKVFVTDLNRFGPQSRGR